MSSILQSQSAANRNVLKRTAFGDVSNTTHQARSTKDDISLAGKNIPLATTKVVGLPGDKMSLNLGLPAQRPISIANIRGLLNDVTSSKGVNVESSKNPGLIDDTAQQFHQPRKILSKRSTTIFKDSIPQVAGNKEISKSNGSTKREVSLQSSSAVLPQQLEMPVITEVSPAIDSYRAEVVRTDISLPKGNPDPDRNYQSKHNDEFLVIADPGEKVISTQPSNKAVTCREVEYCDSQMQSKPATQHLDESINLAPARSEHIPLPSEPEEYWDEDYEDNEEEDGYVTARSYRSRGDNTTGGATMVLFPKYNQKIKREITQAKLVVEATRSPEDIEEEFWDTSMVAEYGNEIFDYMRELEVWPAPS